VVLAVVLAVALTVVLAVVVFGPTRRCVPVVLSAETARFEELCPADEAKLVGAKSSPLSVVLSVAVAVPLTVVLGRFATPLAAALSVVFTLTYFQC
jgi:hypothetical protein